MIQRFDTVEQLVEFARLKPDEADYVRRKIAQRREMAERSGPFSGKVELQMPWAGGFPRDHDSDRIWVIHGWRQDEPEQRMIVQIAQR